MVLSIRTERWYGLIAFCVLSLALHVGMVMRSRAFNIRVETPVSNEIVVSLDAPPQPANQPVPPKLADPPRKPVKDEITPAFPTPLAERVPVIPSKVPVTEPTLPAESRLGAIIHSVRSETRLSPVQPPVVTRAEGAVNSVAPDQPIVKPGGVERASADVLSEHSPLRVVKPPVNIIAAANELSPSGSERLKPEKPINYGLRTAPLRNAPRMLRISSALPGGSAPAPNRVLGGSSGALGPEAPPEDVIFSGQGAGGSSLPRAAPKSGGGGGNSILTVNNPLAAGAVPEDKPGIGPGRGGGLGAGARGGAGFNNGRGIGSRISGAAALSTLLTRPGSGIGAANGSGIGTLSPRGGAGAGSELPGLGGTGAGFGKGVGGNIGPGRGAGVRGAAALGDLAGLLHGGKRQNGGGTGGGPGGQSRGAVFGDPPAGAPGSEKPMHIVYVLDTSGSMKDGNKIGQAEQALKLALAQLKPTDAFNIVTFFDAVQSFSPFMVLATQGNLVKAMTYVDTVAVGNGTNLANAIEAAFSFKSATHIFILSDGLPTSGVVEASKLRKMAKALNTQKAEVNTIALGLGEQPQGVELMKGIAADGGGKFAYIDLGK